MTDKEIIDAFNSGKRMYDLAKEKGMSIDQFKAALLEERNKAVDQAVTDGKITKEESLLNPCFDLIGSFLWFVN